MCVRRYNKKAATASAAAFFGAFERHGIQRALANGKPLNRQFRPVAQLLKPRPKGWLFQRFAAVVVRSVALVFMSLDFLTDSRILLFPKRLAPIFNTVMKMHFAYVAGIDGASTATDQNEHEQGQKTQYRLHGSKGTGWKNGGRITNWVNRPHPTRPGNEPHKLP